MKKTYLDYFYEICKIPRGSGNEQKLAEYLLSFAREHDLEAFIEDGSGNVIIKKPASPGYENAPSVILQGHMDMVCEKRKDSVHDFETDPIAYVRDGNILRTDGTTLGADNGIAVAYAMAVLADFEIEHPAIEVLLTTEEETTMLGAELARAENFKSKYMLNLDSEEEGKLFVSSAGWVDAIGEIRINRVKSKLSRSYRVSVSGLRGGHSGMDIHKGRGNANKILCRLLHAIRGISPEFEIADIQGGRKATAIARDASALINLPESGFANIECAVKHLQDDINAEYILTDSVKIDISSADFEQNVFDGECRDRAIDFGFLVFNGMYSKLPDMDVTQCSQNLGYFAVDEDVLMIEICTRSAIDSLTVHLGEMNLKLFERCGIDGKLGKQYHAWKYQPKSPLRELAVKVYENMQGEAMQLEAIHAGLECGYLSGNLGVDIVSFGPTIHDVHSPDEVLEIDSADRVYEYLLALLKEFKALK